MSGHIVSLDTAAHEACQQLLPWFVTHHLEGAELASVEQHLQVCSQCQADLAWQRKLQVSALNATYAAPGKPGEAGAPDLDAALRRLLPQLTPQTQPSAGAASRWWSALSLSNGRSLRWAVPVQFAAIVLLIARVLVQAPPAPGEGAYRTLGAHDGVGNVVVTFRPDTSELEMRRILHASAARMVDGPTVTDAYVLSTADPARALVQLRGEAAVTLAEQLDSGGSR